VYNARRLGIEGERDLELLAWSCSGTDSEVVCSARKGCRDVGNSSGGGSGCDRSEIIPGLYYHEKLK
jgi:hypothetical protein